MIFEKNFRILARRNLQNGHTVFIFFKTNLGNFLTTEEDNKFDETFLKLTNFKIFLVFLVLIPLDDKFKILNLSISFRIDLDYRMRLKGSNIPIFFFF